MRRLEIFAKGNVDVRDSLLFSRVNGQIQWNGLNPLLTAAHPGHLARVRHEVCARWDLIAQPGASIPPELSSRSIELAPYGLESQFESRLFSDRYDVVVLSIQSDVTNALLRRRGAGYLFFPANFSSWSDADRRWAHESFEETRLLTAEESMQSLDRLVANLRRRGDPHILIYNLSPVLADAPIHCHVDLADALSTRIRRFNLALIERSQQLGFSIVDVDRLVAERGARRVQLDVRHFTSEGYQMLAEEVLRILEDRGCFD
jgi:hypothetical protein